MKNSENENLPRLKIGSKEIIFPIILGPMGVGISLSRLVAAVANEGGAGILTTVGIKEIWSQKLNKEVSTYKAVALEIAKAKKLSPNGLIGINVMVAVQQDYQDSIRAGIDNGIDFISIGAGLINNLPIIGYKHKTAIIPIVSSSKAAKLIISLWQRNKWQDMGYELAGFIVEGPMAGGHLGFTIEQINKPEFQLEAILPAIKKLAEENGNIPIIAAGGIYTREDILNIINLGADGVQMATRFLVTEESGASLDYKLSVIKTKKPEDIIVSLCSPCGMPFRVLNNSPGYQNFKPTCCDKGYLLRKDNQSNFTVCSAKNDNQKVCLCNALLASIELNPKKDSIYTAGANAYRVEKLTTVKEIMCELKGI